jgi:predicted ester cyclase
MPSNADLIRRWFEEVWNQGRESAIDEMCAKDAVGHGQTHDGTDIVGPESFKHFWRAFRAAFSGIHVTFHRTIVEGDLALLHWTISMKHTGAFMGIAATGKTITAKGMSIQRFADGKMVEAWDSYDQLAIMVQLGAVSLENLAPTAKPAEARTA